MDIISPSGFFFSIAAMLLLYLGLIRGRGQRWCHA